MAKLTNRTNDILLLVQQLFKMDINKTKRQKLLFSIYKNHAVVTFKFKPKALVFTKEELNNFLLELMGLHNKLR